VVSAGIRGGRLLEKRDVRVLRSAPRALRAANYEPGRRLRARTRMTRRAPRKAGIRRPPRRLRAGLDARLSETR